MSPASRLGAFRRRVDDLSAVFASEGAGRTLREGAHRLKGSALVFGLEGLAVAAAALEAACDPRGGDEAAAERALFLAAQLLRDEDPGVRSLHDVRGQLGIVLGHVDFLLSAGDDLPPSYHRALREIEAAAARIAALLRPDAYGDPGGATPPAAGRKPVVLVIEDDRSILSLLERKLTKLGAAVSTAVDGATGLRLAGELRPDLVVLDLGLPDLDGRRVLRELQAQGQRVAVSSGDTGEGLERELEALGAFAVIAKPVDDRALEGALARAVALPA